MKPLVDPELYYLRDGEGARTLVQAALGDPDEEGADGLIWHPLVPTGDFDHPQSGPFKITASILRAMTAAFDAGIPTSAGIPIDEDGLHEKRGEGAFGWIEKLEVRRGALWGGIRWTTPGRQAVADQVYKYVSPHFYTNAPPDHSLGRGHASFIFAVALCTTPFFTQQPELRIAAATRLAPGEVDHRGVLPMDEKTCREVLAARLGEITDEAWATLTKDVGREKVDDKTWIEFLASQVPEPQATGDEGTDTDVVQLQERVDELQAAATTATAEATAAADELVAAQAETAEVTATLVASNTRITALEVANKTEAVKAAYATKTFGKSRLGPTAIEVLTTATVTPSAESVQALLKHLEDNGGQVAMFTEGEVGASLDPPPEEDPADAAILKGYTAERKQEFREIAASQDITLLQAVHNHLDALNEGS